ncbi:MULTISPECIES: DUF4163 domain-containing protein [Novosphingobium]|uniref:DUF4163 domain-containing protein n=1 Tax=Novosphingobium TaxID=165696 RepID=UPI000D6E3C2A|nr:MULTISPECIES: DUF4163 domain-containing protein [Novosphingobium]
MPSKPPLGSTLFLALLALGACSDKGQPVVASSTSASASAAVGGTAGPETPPAPATARDVKEENELYQFEYAYPAQAAAIASLRAMLEADLARNRDELATEAKEGAALARESSFPFNPYSRSVNWQVVTDLPGWLSLSALVSFYSGGAHPNYVFDTLLWDRAADKRRAPVDLFTSAAALSAAIRAPFCRELDRQRAKKRGGDQASSGISEFDACIDPAAQTVILGSSNGRTFDRIGVLIAPYAAGPYAEGEYEVTLPVTAKVLEAVRPEYRAAFVTAPR